MSEFSLFAYGTLRGGPAIGGAAGHLTDCVKVGEGTIGGTLYDVDGRFPALVHYGSDPVHGEIWRCPAELLLYLDAYEGTAAGLFRRIATEVELNTGGTVPCWVYTAGPALSQQLTPEHRVASGIWRPRPA
ncbi:MAG TPA: gamma-glutamylcyclotransferase family protein [Longimicrobiales bacterium]|nr:gamma-glutamylcyclotransferase family protein [Longimicrobiales bacterium]